MGLQVEQDMDFQWRDWRAQRVGILLMVAFVLVGAVGLLGPGPLSHAHAASPDDALSVDYLRWARRGREANLTVRVDAARVRDGEVRLQMPARYFDDMELRGVTPEPDTVENTGGSYVFVFAAPRPEAPLTIEFDVQGQGMGALRSEIRVHDAIVRFLQFLWP